MAVEVSDPDNIMLDKPERGSKDGYLQTFNNMRMQFGKIIVESNGVSDHRIRLYTLSAISTVTDDNLRKTMFDYFQQEIEKINKLDIGVDERNQRIADFCVGEMWGQITSFYDQFLGITHRLRLGTV